ncbi:MAG: radical SAM protein [Desulfobacterales bacterium]|nr:radical SAM protein [Desulfobacterales bacterium]
MNIHDVISKSKNGESFSRCDLISMLSLPSEFIETYLIMAEANRISRSLTDNKAEIHAQFSLNLSICPKNCKFCSFAKVNKIFKKETRLTLEQAVTTAKQFETDGANAIFVMTTAHYPFGKFLEVSQEIKRNLNPETVLIANVGDKSAEESKKIKDAGFQGVYHALRLREGTDTDLDPKVRKKSICHFREAGLKVGTCVEPVGPEHSNEEIAEMILYTNSIKPAYSGAARRINIPGTALSQYGMISELRMAQIVAVTRLGVSRDVKGNCTHEPCTLGALGGANLFWAEAGANPRDIEENTENGRGDTVAACSALFKETEWDILKGASSYYE